MLNNVSRIGIEEFGSQLHLSSGGSFSTDGKFQCWVYLIYFIIEAVQLFCCAFEDLKKIIQKPFKNKEG